MTQMHEKILSKVDTARFMKASQWSFNQTWNGKVDISVWLRASMAQGGRVYMLLEYTDQNKKYSVPVARCMTPSSEAHLLNGRVNIVGRGALRDLQIKIKYEGCDPQGFVVEEISLRAIQDKAQVATRAA